MQNENVIQTLALKDDGDQQLVGDEDGVLHPRTEKKQRDVIIIGAGSARDYFRASGLGQGFGRIMREIDCTGMIASLYPEVAAALQSTFESEERRVPKENPYPDLYRTQSAAPYFPVRTPVKKSQKQIKQAKRKQRASSRRNNRK